VGRRGAKFSTIGRYGLGEQKGEKKKKENQTFFFGNFFHQAGNRRERKKNRRDHHSGKKVEATSFPGMTGVRPAEFPGLRKIREKIGDASLEKREAEWSSIPRTVERNQLPAWGEGV